MRLLPSVRSYRLWAPLPASRSAITSGSPLTMTTRSGMMTCSLSVQTNSRSTPSMHWRARELAMYRSHTTTSPRSSAGLISSECW